METDFCVSALEGAMRRYGQPEIFNTDQGTQFTSKAFTDVLKDAEVLISMDGRGRALDNVFIERLWRTVKYEEIYPKEYLSVGELIDSLKDYFKFYNNQRPHASLNGNTPGEVYVNCMHIPSPHSQVTHHGARVAPQRCPILRVSRETITENMKFSKKKILKTRTVPQIDYTQKLLNYALFLS